MYRLNIEDSSHTDLDADGKFTVWFADHHGAMTWVSNDAKYGMSNGLLSRNRSDGWKFYLDGKRVSVEEASALLGVQPGVFSERALVEALNLAEQKRQHTYQMAENAKRQAENNRILEQQKAAAVKKVASKKPTAKPAQEDDDGLPF